MSSSHRIVSSTGTPRTDEICKVLNWVTRPDLAFEWLQKARRATMTASEAVRAVGSQSRDLATLLALNGFTYVTFAEGWCGAVPNSNIIGGEIC